MYTYLHNPRCSKSREALKIMDASGKKFVLRAYLKNALDLDELLDLQEKLGLKAIEFTRINEKEFSEQWLTKDSTDLQIFKKMAHFPNLMQRPIVYNETKAVIWRPIEKVKEIFRK